MIENTELLIKYRDNIVSALGHMGKMEHGEMVDMPPLPAKLNLELANKFLPPPGGIIAPVNPSFTFSMPPPQGMGMMPPPPGMMAFPSAAGMMPPPPGMMAFPPGMLMPPGMMMQPPYTVPPLPPGTMPQSAMDSGSGMYRRFPTCPL